MGWKDDKAWWERNWGSWLLDKAKATAAGIAESLAPPDTGAAAGSMALFPAGGDDGAAPAVTDMMAIIADLEAAAAAATAAAAAAAAEPMPGLSEAEIEAMVNNAAAKAAADALAAAAAAAAVDEAFSEAFVEPSKEASAVAAADAAAAAAAVADADQKFFEEVVGPSKDWDNFLKAMASGGPPNTQITINSTAVSGQEVVDALGAFVDTNGPLPPHWQQSATD